MSGERRSLLAAYGATLVLTPDTRGMHGAIAQGRGTGARESRLLHAAAVSAIRPIPKSITRPPAPSSSNSSTASTLSWRASAPAGTISGTGRYLREKLPNRPLIIAVEPKNSPVLEGGEAGFHKIQGIGAGFIPANLDTTIYDEVIAISDEDATTFSRRIGARRGPAGRNFLGRQLLRRAANRQAARSR